MAGAVGPFLAAGELIGAVGEVFDEGFNLTHGFAQAGQALGTFGLGSMTVLFGLSGSRLLGVQCGFSQFGGGLRFGEADVDRPHVGAALRLLLAPGK
ncbi:MAG: hypothetical protein HZT41_10340 [Dechloromonas sp.]|nr:MAG: hypothetical protein HZT41_10340 [Dechloromonas sp.]